MKLNRPFNILGIIPKINSQETKCVQSGHRFKWAIRDILTKVIKDNTDDMEETRERVAILGQIFQNKIEDDTQKWESIFKMIEETQNNPTAWENQFVRGRKV
jgi:hypothetical protein